MKSAKDLHQLLEQIDRRGYPAYKETAGAWRFEHYVLGIDHVQGDPFAAPSRLHVEISEKVTGIPSVLRDAPYKKTALEDHLLRRFVHAAGKYSFQAKGSGKSGVIAVMRPGQEVLARSAVEFGRDGTLTARFEVGFPANGRTINARELIKILYQFLPQCVEQSFIYENIDRKAAQAAVDLAEDQASLRRQMKEQGLVAFVADGAVLPRASGVSDLPMKDAVAFRSPDSLRISLDLSGGRTITGMGIRQGITLLVGGGYHGKSTLLKALERGVYTHIAGDGREYVLTDADAVKIRAEDGRSIWHTDISMFIGELPNQKSTVCFDSEDASGSTSQAANVVEAIEAGASALLIDEDTSATNFMIRDELMQRVIARDKEPITPYIERVQELKEQFGVSTILVAGSCGAYIDVADTIIQMDSYLPCDITAYAKKLAEDYPSVAQAPCRNARPCFDRRPDKHPDVYEKGRIKLKVQGREGISIGREMIDLRYVEQLVDSGQLQTLAYVMKYMEEYGFDQKHTVQELIQPLYERLEKDGFSALFKKPDGGLPGNLAMPRRPELYACLNRYRKLLCSQKNHRADHPRHSFR